MAQRQEKDITEALLATTVKGGVKLTEKGVAKAVIKVVEKGTIATAKTTATKAGGKTLAKKIPLMGLFAGIGFAAKRIYDKPTEWSTYALATGEIVSGAVSLVPGAGTLVSLAIDGTLLVTDIGMTLAGSESPPAEEEPKCICNSITINVLYVNMGSINPDSKSDTMIRKIDKLKQLISTHRPHLIAIVESWLTAAKEDDKILESLNLHGYTIFRHDRKSGHHPDNAHGYTESTQSNRRGGGVLVLWRTDSKINATLKRNPNEDFADNVVNFDLYYSFNCTNCCEGKRTHKYGITIIYRRPSRFKDQDKADYEEINHSIIDQLAHVPPVYVDQLTYYSKWAMFGDFNWNPEQRQHQWFLDYITSIGNGTRCLLSSQSTHRSGNVLDHVISSPDFVVNSVNFASPVVDVTELVSDHAAFVFSLKLGKDYSTDNPCRARKCN